jgi:alkanesulfonate monooxygenase SsuD/methylene tetrahydromethanopterin reductase-like flavin-dependent oxidoreductase (luciferase family)
MVRPPARRDVWLRVACRLDGTGRPPETGGVDDPYLVTPLDRSAPARAITWDPLVTLAAVAVVTRRIRLLTAALVLPPRDEAVVAKQAAVNNVLEHHT